MLSPNNLVVMIQSAVVNCVYFPDEDISSQARQHLFQAEDMSASFSAMDRPVLYVVQNRGGSRIFRTLVKNFFLYQECNLISPGGGVNIKRIIIKINPDFWYP